MFRACPGAVITEFVEQAGMLLVVQTAAIMQVLARWDAGRAWYPRWGSNPHWIAFKATASADWATGARMTSYVVAAGATSTHVVPDYKLGPTMTWARRSTASVISSVSLPVKVFC